jgi:hypothetical protein
LLAGALQCTVRVLGGAGGSIYLTDEVTGAFVDKAFIGSRAIHEVWTRLKELGLRPSDRVIGTRTPLLVDDLRTLLPARGGDAMPAISTLTVPILAGDEMLGLHVEQTLCHELPDHAAPLALPELRALAEHRQRLVVELLHLATGQRTRAQMPDPVSALRFRDDGKLLLLGRPRPARSPQCDVRTP